jgi:DNA-binding NarL/FixJ family response regulator
LDIGAVGFIHKDITAAVILNAIRMILSGGIYVPPNLMNAPQEGNSKKIIQALTPRQRQVLIRLAAGDSNKGTSKNALFPR